MNIIQTIRENIARYELFPDNASVVAGVSGGADSVALAHALHRLEIPFHMAHLNHQLRGAESDADEEFVRSLGYPVTVKSVDVKKLAKDQGLSIEMAARQARHDFFAEFDHAVIALAHHADDQVETFFLKLARGAGSDGLGGMAFSQQIGPLQLVRPMLNIPGTELLKWLNSNDYDWRDDSSNTDETFLRNRVRHTILPMLEKELNPHIREAVLRTMNILQEENAWMESLQDQSTTLAAKRRKLRAWLFEQGVQEAGFEAVEQILEQMQCGQGTTVYELNDRQRVVVEYGTPRFEDGTVPVEPAEWILSTRMDHGWKKDSSEIGILPAEASFNAEKIGNSPIEVRGWQAGDRMEPLGMEGSRKLQDILTDLKIPREQRAQIPVVVCRGAIIWLPGYRIARGWEVQGIDAPAVQICIEQNGTV